MNLFTDILNNSLTKDDFPLMLTDENPQVLADIRKQIFGLQEDILLQARRIFERLTQYVTVPQVFKPKKIRLRTHMHCFIAKEFLDWLVASRECVSRKEGVELCQKMQEKEIIHPLLKDNTFSDDESIFKFGDKGSQSSSRRGSEQVESIQGGMTSKQQTDLLHRLRLLHEESIDGADDDHIEEVDGEDVDVLVQLYTIAQVRCDQSAVNTSDQSSQLTLTSFLSMRIINTPCRGFTLPQISRKITSQEKECIELPT
jgi:hypothetical protein